MKEKMRIGVLNQIAPQGLALFGADYEVGGESKEAEGIMVRSAKVATGEFNNLLAVARAGAGFNNITVDEATKAGVCVMNTPGANANAVAELVFVMLGMVIRKVPAAMFFAAGLKNEQNDVIHAKMEKEKAKFQGSELIGKTLCVLGLGKIGVLVANAGLARGMKVVGYDPSPTAANMHLLNAGVTVVRTLDEAAENADVVTVHVPLNPKTRHIINASVLEKTKDGCILMNYSRDGICDEEAVLGLLELDVLGTYVTDFPTRELLDAKNVVCTPHLGATTAEAEENCATMAAQQLKDYLEFGITVNAVNFPLMDERPSVTTATRLIVINDDVPDMIAVIAHVLGKAKLNIQSLVNKGNGKVGYNAIDLEVDVPDTVIAEIGELTHVIKVRKLTFGQ